MATTNANANGSIKVKGSRLSLRNRKQLQDISPAPVPRSSHRIRTLSVDTDEKLKVTLLSKRSQSSASLPQSNNSDQGSQSEKLIHSYNGLSSFGRVYGICPLANLGNTCFLNSVLYALRFLPGFIHDLHHLYLYSKSIVVQKENASLISRQKFVEELHELFKLLRKEEKASTDSKRIPAIHPIKFLESIRTVNPVFEGNRQQDAHELVHSLLDQLFNLPQDFMKNLDSEEDEEGGQPPKMKRRKRAVNTNGKTLSLNKARALDLVGSKFVGQMVLETRCCECEKTNGRAEDFLEVCVPVKTKSETEVDDDEKLSDTDVLLTALCKEDVLCGTNKYWCDFCCHHNEAERFVHYKTMPHNLLIHVKRFSSNARTSATKCCDAMPAPFELPCFCHECRLMQLDTDPNPSKENCDSHLPYFLRSFVCHLGATISSGHYISFVHISPKCWSSCAENLKEKCSFLSCCASHLDRITPPQAALNGHSKDEESSKGIWLECDDDKIKVVSSSDVIDAMKSNNLTPYLLFYSR